MEQPSKRPRLTENADTEDFDLGEARARNDLKLKSRFESIFEKYGKDFSSMGDEIDLKTGAIVVDNGHLQEMQNEQDIGRGGDGPAPADTGSPDWVDSHREFNDAEPSFPPNEAQRENSDPRTSDSEADETLPSHSPANPAQETTVNLKNKTSQSNHKLPHNSGRSERCSGNSERKETPSTEKTFHSIPPTDPLWQTPDIEGLLPNRVSKSAPMYTPPDRAMSLSPSNGKSLWARPWTRVLRKDKEIKKVQKRPPSNQPRRKLFSTPELQALRNFKFASVGAESDDSDDPLQDDSYQTPTRRASPQIGKRASGSNTAVGCNDDGKKICNFCKETFPELQFGHHLDEILLNDEYDGIHDLEEIRRSRETLKRPEASEKCKYGKSPLISSEVAVSMPVPVSGTSILKTFSSHQRTMSPAETNPLQLDENEVHIAQDDPDQEDVSNDFDPLADDDRFSTTSGLSSLQIEPSPAKTPRRLQGTSSPLTMRYSAKKSESAERFGLFSKRPIKVPIFRTNRWR